MFAVGFGQAGESGSLVQLAAGVLMAALALVTLYTTGMIYASLPTIPAWNQPLTAPGYIVLGLASGAVLLSLLLAMFEGVPVWAVWLAILMLIAAFAVKTFYWIAITGEKPA